MKTLGCVLLGALGLVAQTTESIPFRAELSPLNEIPIIENVAASGKATVWMHVVRNAKGDITSAAVDFTARYAFPGPVTVTGFHIHRGTAAVNGPVVIDSGVRGADATEDATGKAGVIRQALVTTEAGLTAVRDILADSENFYVNLHSSVNPGGIIRGQLIRATMTTTMGLLSSANEIPVPQGITATGTATVIALAARNKQGQLVSGEVTFDVQYTGFAAETKFTGLHVHTGEAGVNGPVTLNSGFSGPLDAAASGTGSLRFTADINTSNAASAAALAGLATAPANYYTNLHTTVNPGGAIRAQMRRPDSVTFSLNATPGAEVPPIADSTASAAALFSLHSLRDSKGVIAAAISIFDISHSFPADTAFTGTHIHQAAFGQNGPVLINSGLSGSLPSASGNGNIYRIGAVTSAAGLAAVNALLQDPSGFYFNLHTAVSPGGAVRVQLASPAVDLPVVTDVFGVKGGSDDRVAGLGSRFRIAGTNLALVAGSAGDGNAPLSLNGTSVTLNGVDVELISVSPTSIVGRVPASVALGNLPQRGFPVFVTTKTGKSSVSTILVSSQPGDN